MMNETSLIQVMILTPVRVWPGLQFTSTTVPTMTGKVLVVVMSETAAGSSVHVSEGERLYFSISHFSPVTICLQSPSRL